MTFFLFIILFLSANDILESTLERAIQSYHNKDFKESLQSFQELENESLLNENILYNIGNCYFQLGQIGKAILYYKRCLKLSPGHEQAGKNLSIALTLTKDQQGNEQSDFLTNLWERILITFPLNSLALILISLFFVIIVVINVIIFRYRNREKTAPMFLLFLLLFLFLFFILLSLTQWNRFHDDSKAVLIASTEIGYSGPSEEFTRVFTIHEGMILEIEKTENEWSLIKLPNGIGGWIRTNSFEKI
jgi:tetratricopeptide (TPR) repeat protein